MENLTRLSQKWLRLSVLCLLAIDVLFPVVAQRAPDYSYEDDYIFWGNPSAYLEYQAKIAFPLIDAMLQVHPPKEVMNQHRRMALVTLDQFLHETNSTRQAALYSFATTRMARMLTAMDEPLTSGVRICKLPNSGFIIKSPKTVVAVDLVAGSYAGGSFLSDSIIYEILFRSNALLITNADSRHCNSDIAQLFTTFGKKVIAPKGVLKSLGDKVMHMGDDYVQTVELEGMTLNVVPGHNGNAANNIYIIEFTGYETVAHTGAQNSDADWDIIDLIHQVYDVDILLTKSQSTQLERMIAGFQPTKVITTGENEMENSIDLRESYWTTQKRMSNLDYLHVPNIVMTWGEIYDYANGEQTDISAISDNTSSSSQKVFKNGRIYIRRNGQTYTLTGVRVK